METIAAADAKTNFEASLDKAQRGPVTISENGRRAREDPYDGEVQSACTLQRCPASADCRDEEHRRAERRDHRVRCNGQRSRS